MEYSVEDVARAFASGLMVENLSQKGEDRSKPASEEIKKLFEKNLLMHLEVRTEHLGMGKIVSYEYQIAKIRGGSRPISERSVNSPNINLMEVMNTLPLLKKGQSYAFPNKTSASFKIIGKEWKKSILTPHTVCEWVQEALAKKP